MQAGQLLAGQVAARSGSGYSTLRTTVKADPATYQDILSSGNKQVGSFARLAEGETRHRVTPFVENLRLAVPIPGDIPFRQHNTAVGKACGRKGAMLRAASLSEAAALCSEKLKDHLPEQRLPLPDSLPDPP